MSISSFFSSEGPLAEHIPGFEVRPGQITLATLVEAALSESQICCVEAGTGIGKTLAYLVPAIRSGKRVMISTATKVLQEQLLYKDIPVLRAIMTEPIQVRVIKGRHNYLCLQSLAHFKESVAGEGARGDVAYQHIVQWAQNTRSGEFSELPDWPGIDSWQSQFAARRETCTTHQCPYFASCFLFRSRKEAARADIVIVNHHLFAHEYLRNEEAWELPDIDAVIFDEAHHLPMVLKQCLGHRVFSPSLMKLCEYMRNAIQTSFPDAQELLVLLSVLSTEIAHWQSQQDHFSVGQSSHSKPFLKEDLSPKHIAVIEQVHAYVMSLVRGIQAHEERSQRLSVWHDTWCQVHEALVAFLEQDAQFVHRVIFQYQGIQLLSMPIHVEHYLPQVASISASSFLFLSATLSIHDSLDFFIKQLGFDPEQCVTEIIPAPFMYEEQGALWVPLSLPEPMAPEYLDEMLVLARQLIEASQGGTLFLCSSVRHVQLISESLQKTLSDYLVIVADSTQVASSLARFKTAERAVLVGSQVLWEGIDIVGQGLRLVLIDKIPFAAPNDPVIEAERMKSVDSIFFSYQLPTAILLLKQGIGRLIRSSHDQGAVAIFDSRILQKSYGRLILKNMPDFKRIDNFNMFLSYIHCEVAKDML